MPPSSATFASSGRPSSAASAAPQMRAANSSPCSNVMPPTRSACSARNHEPPCHPSCPSSPVTWWVTSTMPPDRILPAKRRKRNTLYQGPSRMRTNLLVAIATSLFALPALAQQYPASSSSYPDLTGQQQLSGDCSDPSQANSVLCRGASGGVGLSPLNLGSYSGIGAQNSSQPGMVNTYTDEATGLPRTVPRPNVPLPPEPLTEFQKFIASTTGQVLPIYGAKLFQNVPSTFSPLENTPVPSDYVLGPDDELRVRVWGQVNFNANVRVDRNGDIYLPQIGAIHVAGLRFDELQNHVRDAISRVYRNFQVIAEMGQIRSIQIYVTGEARRPGVYTVSSLATLLDALFTSGGPSVQGSMRHIELRRAGQTITTLDLYRLLVDGDKSQDAKLLSGDVIYVGAVGGQVGLYGSVRRPAIYELAPGETLSATLRFAGGATSLASDSRVSLERNLEHSGRQAMEARLDTAGLATALQDGDLLQIIPIASQFQKTVTLRGNTANPGRYAWHEGMHLSELIPDREALLTRDYWWKRTQLGLPAPEFQPITAYTVLRQPETPLDLRAPRPQPAPATAAPDQQQTSSNPQTQFTSSEDPYQEFDSNLLLAPVTPTRSATQDPSNPQTDVAVVGQSSPTNRANQTALAEPLDETAQSLNPPRTQRNIVKLNVPEIDWSYAVIERIEPNTLKTQLVPFDLGKLVIEHEGAQDKILQPGDIVTIFSQNDIRVPISEQTVLVRLEGEFLHSGTYTALPGESLRQLVERAGGLSPDAYLYGSVFTRESTRILQQRRIDESIRQMALEMERGSLALAANPVSGSSSVAGVTAAQSSEREILAQLQQVRANGRIVFPFRPDSSGLTLIPDLKLENGDTFMVPAIPSTVNVLGAVYNQNSFIYRRGAEVSSFLDLAGGPNVNADRGREFVIRANGDVVARPVVKGVWGNEFAHLRLYPGDSIIVPEKTLKPSALRGILDWSQVISQLAFGAAAINVLR
ncbi:sugar transporter [Acidobacteria bacterium AB60]|nr:sugar transporter [Acidobacteria bacterium AB60]